MIVSVKKKICSYTDEPLTLEEVSFLLWASQGAREAVQREGQASVMRTVPSAGARHPFETYLMPSFRPK